MNLDDLNEMNKQAKTNPAEEQVKLWNEDRLRRSNKEQERIKKRMEYLKKENETHNFKIYMALSTVPMKKQLREVNSNKWNT